MLKNKIKNKIKFLMNFTLKEFKNSQGNVDYNPFLEEYIEIIKNLAKKINYRLPIDFHLTFCKNCDVIRTCENTKYRTENRKKNKKNYKYLVIRCLNCGYLKKINITKKDYK